MESNISKDFQFLSFIKFALPTIIMMMFMSLYTIVDGIFVSRFVGTDALSATNIVYPVINVVLAIAVMLSTGGNAIIAKKMGEGENQKAREYFTFLVLTGVAAGLVIGITGLVFIDPICRFLGASDLLIGYCKQYLPILLFFAPASILQILFQAYFVTAGVPGLGLLTTIMAGIMNAILDYVFIVPLNMGVAGAALATAIGYMIPASVGLVFFLSRKSTLYFVKPRFYGKILLKACGNGSSEMVTNISMGIITMLYNILMMYYVGENGVASITIVLYAQFLLDALHMGFSIGVAPIISFNYGSKNNGQLKKIFKFCMKFIGVASIVLFCLAILFHNNLVAIFSPRGTAVFELASRGFLLFSFSFLFTGLNIFSSAMFTAYSNGKISAIISFLRTFVFIFIGLMLLPLLFNTDGIWIAVPIAELLTAFISVYFLRRFRKSYHYA